MLGAFSLAFAIWKTQGLARRRWLAMAAAFAIACATLAIEVRALTQVATIPCWGAVFVGVSLARRMRAPLLSIAPVIFMSPLFWAIMKAATIEEPVGAPSSRACYLPDSYQKLAALHKGLVLAPINLGGHIIAHTPHSVLGGAYHRISKENRAVLEMLLAPPDEARALLRNAGVFYVALCFDADTLATISQRAPAGLAATLMRDQAAIDWLAPADQKSGPVPEPLRIYKVR
jgi:hypothetical protein